MTFQNIGFSLPQTGLYIDGEWRESADVFPVHNPADGSQVAEVANGSADDAVKALDAAVRAQPEWARDRATRTRKPYARGSSSHARARELRSSAR